MRASAPSPSRSCYKFQHMLGQSPTQDPNEQEFIMAMLKSWEEGKAEARAEGQAEGQAKSILTVLRIRGIEVPPAARERILAQKDIDQLARWLEKATVASTIGEVIDEPR
ncbi:MAG TPA: hypothetical protein VF516_35320 [Kofleriaceae bacterium]